MKETGNICPIAANLINIPLPPLKGKPWLIREICVTSPWPAVHKLIWTIYCSLFKLETQSLEDCKIFPEVQALRSGSYPSLIGGDACSVSPRPVGPDTPGRAPWLCSGWMVWGNCFLSAQVSISFLFVVLMCCFRAHTPKWNKQQFIPSGRMVWWWWWLLIFGLIFKQPLSTVLKHPGHWKF